MEVKVPFNNFDTSTKTSTGQSYNNQYDLQKTAVRDEEAKRRKLEQDALQRQLASRGFGAGSGFAEGAQNQLQQSNLAGERARLMGIDVNQLSAAEASNEADRARNWQTGERQGSQEFQTGERQGTETYNSSEANKNRAFTTGEREGTQTFQTGERLGAEKFQGGQFDQEIALKNKALDDAANQFASKLDFDYWAQNAGYDEADRARAWEEVQKTKERNFTVQQDEVKYQNTQDLAILGEELAQGRLTLQDTMARNSAALKTRTDLMFNIGANGTELDPDVYDTLSQLEKDSYNSGIQGKSKEDYDAFIKDQIDLRNQKVLAAASPDSEEGIVDTIDAIWKEYEYLFPGETAYRLY